MTIRPIVENDLEELKDIYELFFKDEFKFPDFSKFVGSFAVVNDNNHIILAGGIRPLMEGILLTDKSLSPRIRKEALLRAMKVSMDMCESIGFHQLHCWIQDNPTYIKGLSKYGFKPIKGDGLVLSF